MREPCSGGEVSPDYYARQSPMSDPGRRRALFDGLPGDVRSLARIIHGLGRPRHL
jgi:hypothetical protein